MSTTILAIESSCDDTSAAIIQNGQILSNCIASQNIHKEYGGVVPEVASRQHQMNIIPVVQTALRRAGVDKHQLSAIAFTKGPGLMGSLMVGVSFAKSMALALNIPIIEVHHMRAHILAHFIEEPFPTFPFLCLVVSGGHTQIYLVKDHLNMELLGQTRDDAAGEAFDKSGKLLGLDYPAGPEIDRLSKFGKPIYEFPKPSIPGLDFSFSGLKTAILYFLRTQVKANPDFIDEELNNVCASIQTRIVDILLDKFSKASENYQINQMAISGGVSANSQLREQFLKLGREKKWKCYVPRLEYCTDNAAMIAITAHYKFKKGIFANQSVRPEPRFKMNAVV